MMLFLLPWAFLFSLFLFFAGWRDRKAVVSSDLQAAYLAAVAVWGTLLVLITEGLSLVGGIARPWLALAWLASAAVVFAFGWRGGAIPRGWRRLRDAWAGISRGDWLVIAAVSAVCLALLMVAFVSPPNNVDSLIYHMGRVVHWAQNHSLRHYVPSNVGQLIKPIWAEAAILNLRVLWGSDRPANLVQWFSMVTSLAAVGGLAQLLGASRKGQLLAISFAVSVPMGVLQATSTQNDYVVAMWVMCLIYFVVLAQRSSVSLPCTVLVGLSLGLGILTKGTFYAYAFPIMLWFLLHLWRKVGLGRLVVQGMVIGLLTLALNFGFWARNIQTFGGPYGVPGALPLVFQGVFSRQAASEDRAALNHQPATAEQVGEVPETSAEPEAANVATQQTPGGTEAPDRVLQGIQWFLRRLAQNLGQNTVMPTRFVTSTTWGLMQRVPWLFTRDFVESLREGMWNHEDTAGNLLHLLLGLAAIAALMLGAIRRRDIRMASAHGLVAFAGYTMLILISYSVELFGVRYQLPFFILCGPLVGLAAGAFTRRSWLAVLLTALLLASAVPYVLLNNTRPIVGWRPKTRVASVLVAEPVDILYAMAAGYQDEDSAIAAQVRSSGCRAVGLMVGPSGYDYLWWWLLEAPQSGIRIENMEAAPLLQRYTDPGFRPCAIICRHCSGVSEIAGLPLEVDYGHVSLYLADD